jgi:hypothetical protein
MRLRKQVGDVIRIRLEPKAGQVLGTTRLPARLDYPGNGERRRGR